MMACHFIFRHPAPLLAYPSGLGSPKVDLQQKKKEGERGQEAETHVGETAPKKEKKTTSSTVSQWAQRGCLGWEQPSGNPIFMAVPN